MNPEFIASNLRFSLALTDPQNKDLKPLLKEYFEKSDEWDPTLGEFFEDNQAKLSEILREEQLYFFDGNSFANGQLTIPVLTSEWKTFRCTDCHSR